MPYLYRLHKNGEIEEIIINEVHHRGYDHLTEEELLKYKEFVAKRHRPVRYYGKNKEGKQVIFDVPGYPDYYVQNGTNARSVFSKDPNFERARNDLEMVRKNDEKRKYDDYMKRMRRLCRMI